MTIIRFLKKTYGFNYFKWISENKTKHVGYFHQSILKIISWHLKRLSSGREYPIHSRYSQFVPPVTSQLTKSPKEHTAVPLAEEWACSQEWCCMSAYLKAPCVRFQGGSGTLKSISSFLGAAHATALPTLQRALWISWTNWPHVLFLALNLSDKCKFSTVTFLQVMQCGKAGWNH